MNRVTLQNNDNAAEGVLYMAMELSDKRWKLVFSDGSEKHRHEAIEAGRRMELVEAIWKAKVKFHLSPEARVVSGDQSDRVKQLEEYQHTASHFLHRYVLSARGIRSATEASGRSMSATHASITSLRLCGGIFVAMPTAIPLDPLISRFGMRAGSTEGSRSDSS